MGSGEHVLDKPLMAGDVDDAELRAVGQCEVREAQVDGDTALFFFLEPVGVLAGERFDQTGFTVIDMAGGADDVGLLECSSKFKVQGSTWRLRRGSRASPVQLSKVQRRASVQGSGFSNPVPP